MHSNVALSNLLEKCWKYEITYFNRPKYIRYYFILKKNSDLVFFIKSFFVIKLCLSRDTKPPFINESTQVSELYYTVGGLLRRWSVGCNPSHVSWAGNLSAGDPKRRWLSPRSVFLDPHFIAGICNFLAPPKTWCPGRMKHAVY